MSVSREVVSAEMIEGRIVTVRGQRVVLDADLAMIYGVTTKRLNQQVARNRKRFPPDFSFVLTAPEVANLKSQSATSSLAWGGRRSRPRVFTEHGAVMAASVLNTPVAINASVEVVRAFVRLRHFLAAHAELARKLDELERKYGEHDQKLALVFQALRELANPPPPPPRQGRIGFRSPGSEPQGRSSTASRQPLEKL